MSKIQSLKINPFTLNSINHPTIDIESLNDIQNKFELELDKNCQYMFSEDFNTKYTSDQSDFSFFSCQCEKSSKKL